ncbi:MAG TPA: hypothetical protein VGO11_11435 [Chthoniobacteraceae bacterium]|jgi:hypothetical protein|nr:hypothetical protein [Chthoniobacteraceae bacterium]
MPRLSPLPQLILLACAAALPVGCKTIYTDVYSPRGNHFVPPKEKKIELPEEKKKPVTPVDAVPVPGAPDAGGIPGLMAPPEMGAPAPAVPAPAP